jgi:hypothetical protein
MVANTWTDAVRQLIDAYEEIAEALGNLAFFRSLIQSRDHLKLVLEDYFSDILRFHRCILDVFSRPGSYTGPSSLSYLVDNLAQNGKEFSNGPGEAFGAKSNLFWKVSNANRLY